MADYYRTHQDASRILVEQVDEEGAVVDMRLSMRTDLPYLTNNGMSGKDALRLIGVKGATPGGIQDHLQEAKVMAGRAVNWTGERTETGFVFVVAK